MEKSPGGCSVTGVYNSKYQYDHRAFVKSTLKLTFSLYLAWQFMLPQAMAQSWLQEGAREFEELRLRQLQTVQKDANLAPFTTDGCSGRQSYNWKQLAKLLPGFEKQFGDKPPWEKCCVIHDRAYWRGSAVDGYKLRKEADEKLEQCVIDTGARLAPELGPKYSVPEEKVRHAFRVTAALMYQAVRLGGQPCSLLPWRWGYGWPNCAFARISDIPKNVSDIKSDETVTFFNTAAWIDPDTKHWNIPIHAWIYEPEDSAVRKGITAALLESKYDLKVTPDTEDNFRQRVNLLIADNERGKKLVIRIAGQDIPLSLSKENGHIFTILKLPTEAVNASSNQGRLHYFAVTSPQESRRFEGDVQLVYRYGISVISDIDDTIKITHVTDHKQLFNNTFFKDFQAVPGMSELYRQLTNQGAALHFVSSSPWQLYGPLMSFTQQADFPWATMSLKYVRFRDKTLLNLFKKGTETKPEQIEPLLQRFPKRRFILIGDSGEQDPEVYGDIARRFPSQIYHILIRNVDNSTERDRRYKLAFKDIPKSKWRLFDQPEQAAIDGLLGRQ